jgi:signal transduction histidine kinase
MIAVPLEADGERRGVLEAVSAQPDAFGQDDLSFLQIVAWWVAVVTQRNEFVEQTMQGAVERTKTMAGDELVMVLAHDIRNYMTPIKGRMELVRRRASSDGRTRDIEDIDAAQSALHRLDGLVEDLLDSARLEQGLFSLAIQKLDLVSLVRETAALLHGEVNEIQVHAPGEPEEACIEADPSRMRQVFENLLSNAFRHSPKGVPVVAKISTQERRDGNWTLVKISDRGPGIPAEVLPHLFERFSAGPQSEGLGLGLYIAYGIVAAHGGRLEVDSAPGKGATFCVALPTLSRLDRV